MKPDKLNQKGFTLIELMIAIAIAGMVIAVMTSFQMGQTRSHVTQAALNDMQQNARAAMHFMTSEIRMAGCDPSGTAGARILAASDSMIRFSMDIAGGAGPAEIINLPKIDGSGGVPILRAAQYSLGVPNGAIDVSGEDITYQLTNNEIERVDNIAGTPPSMIAPNIDALEFVYLNADGDRIPTPTDGSSLGTVDRQRIRSVQVTVLARSGSGSPGFVYHHTDTSTYTNRWGDDLHPANDNFRRILLSTETSVRNRE